MKKIGLLIAMLGVALGYAQDVKFKLKGIEDYTGVIRVAVYENESDYKKESTDLKFTFKKENLLFGLMEIGLKLEPGKYVIAFLDDTNLDARMNYNMLGIPKEGYAFSRIKDYGYSRPAFKEALIEVKDNDENNFEIRFNYF